jgi:hypothetical protein
VISGHPAVDVMTFKLDQPVHTFNIHVSVYLSGKQARPIVPSCSSVNSRSLIIVTVLVSSEYVAETITIIDLVD